MAKSVLIFALFFVSTVAAADVYKCQGKDGTAYQETPCKGGKKIDIPDTPVNSRNSQIESAISLREVIVGMTKEQAIRAWGKPDKINKTMGTGYSSEQWIYERGSIARSQYLYFDNGVLRSMQGPGE